MIGITSYGAYIPIYRLSRAEIAKTWNTPPAPGEKAIANYDEDSVTMAVAACRDCISGMERNSIDSLYLASTTFPYKEKQSATIVSTALDLAKKAFTMDLSNSLRCGTSAVKAAMDAINAKAANSALVCAADVRLGLPNGSKEMDFGDGAAAFLIGDSGVIATIDGYYSINDEVIDLWRSSDDTFVRSWEDRFVREKGYTRVVIETVTAALKKWQLAPKDFAKVVFSTPNPGILASVTKSLGFDSKTQVQDSLYNVVGNTGCALPLMILVAALEEAKAGDKILWLGYGDGCDIFVLTVTAELARMKEKRGIKKHLVSKLPLTSYEKYLRWRQILVTEPPARPPLDVPSAVALFRDSKGGLALYGVKCRKCGTPQYPVQRVCIECHDKDNFDPYCFADKVGKITTFSQDNLAFSIDPPTTTSAVDFINGGRIMCDVTDRDPQKIQVGMQVEMTFRKLRAVGGIHDYWWKCQPVRC